MSADPGSLYAGGDVERDEDERKYRQLHDQALQKIASGQMDEMVNRVLREAGLKR